VWRAAYTVTNGTIEANHCNVSITVIDHDGNTTTQSSTRNMTLDNVAPRVVSIDRLDAETVQEGSDVHFRVTFSETVDEIHANVFTLTGTNSVTASINQVTKVNGQTYDVSVTGHGSGQLRLDILDTVAIGVMDAKANHLESSFITGQSYTFTPITQVDLRVPLPSVPQLAVSEKNTVPNTPSIINTQITPGGVLFQTESSHTETPVVIVRTSSPSGIPGSASSIPTCVGGFSLPVGLDHSTISLSGLSLDSTHSEPIRTYPQAPHGQVLLNVPIPDVQLTSAVFSVQIPADAFAYDVSNRITLSVQLADGRPLPAWLHFDSVTGKITGSIPPGYTQELAIKVIARDPQGHQAFSVFKLVTPKAGQGKGISVSSLAKPSLAKQFDRFSHSARQSVWAFTEKG
jgi:Putative Ig domain